MDSPFERDADQLAAADSALAAARALSPTLPVVIRTPGFPTMLHLILEQQISIDAAAVMFRRLEETLGTVTPEGFLALDRPTLERCGFSRQKAGYAADLAGAVITGSFSFSGLETSSDEDVTASLTELRGIGPWTAECYLLFALQRRDVFPAGDLALRRSWQETAKTAALPTTAELRLIAAVWSPRRSAAALILWGAYLARRGRT